jgi:hypothetical protein
MSSARQHRRCDWQLEASHTDSPSRESREKSDIKKWSGLTFGPYNDTLAGNQVTRGLKW